MIQLLCTVTLLLVESATAQIVAIPSSWRKPTVNITRQQAVDIAAAALDKAYAEIVPGETLNCDYNMLLAEFDIATNQTRYKVKVADYFKHSANYKPRTARESVSSIVALWWLTQRSLDPTYGYAAALAYVAYNNRAFLDIATAAWDSNNQYVLPRTGIPAAFQNKDESEIVQDAWDDHRKCLNSNDLSGGIMHYPKVDVVTSENARFLRFDVLQLDLVTLANLSRRLSGMLSQITGNLKYLNATRQSARLLLSQLYTDDSLFWWQITLNMSEPCNTPIIKRKEPWNAGTAIEGLAILSSISPNETINDKLIATLYASSNYGPWHESQGILVKQSGAADIVRGFATVHAHKDSYNTNTSSYVESYLAVQVAINHDLLSPHAHYISRQYNAVLDKATVNGTNIYGNSWIGPPNSTYSADSQLTAARVLIAGISLASQIELTSAPSEMSSPDTNVSHVGAIVGGTIGGLVFITLILAGSHFIIRHCRQHTVSPSTEVMRAYHPSITSIEETPYYLNPSEVTVSDTWTPSMGYVWQSEKLPRKMHIANPNSQSDASSF
ncbi:hypothetical protein VNI00_015800 [Paramarasmius palmivorus]|uniref:Glycoside hydrolase family 76 protein n=1 Tax=Paramarasmius palmivorus TaxID=297713 RepID=A0AAW0BIF1_9AGAR